MSRSKIPEERIEILFKQAEEKFSRDRELSDRYVEIARRIGERTQTSIPEDLRKKFCSNCETYWRPGETCKVGIDSKKNLVKYSCLECGEEKNYGY